MEEHLDFTYPLDGSKAGFSTEWIFQVFDFILVHVANTLRDMILSGIFRREQSVQRMYYRSYSDIFTKRSSTPSRYQLRAPLRSSKIT
jgi:hypothetical protein